MTSAASDEVTSDPRAPSHSLCRTASQSASCSPRRSPVTRRTFPHRIKSASLMALMKAVLQASAEFASRSLSVGGDERWRMSSRVRLEGNQEDRMSGKELRLVASK